MKFGGFIKSIILVFTVFFAAEFLFLISPKLINTQKYKTRIVKILEKETGEKFDYEQFSFKTYPDFSIKVNAVNPEIKNIVTADSFEIKFGLPKLIFKKFVIKNIKADNVKLYVQINKDKTTNLDNLLVEPPFDIDIKKAALEINKYKVFVSDKFVNQNSQISGEKISAKITDSNIDLILKGQINAQNEIADIDLSINMPNPDKKKGLKNKNKYFIVTGYIKNLRPHIFKEYIKTFTDKDLQDLQGVINAEFKPTYDNGKIKSIDTNVIIDNLKIISKVKEKSIIFNNKNTIKSAITIDKKNLIVNDFEFKGDKFNITMDGFIRNWGTKTPTLDLEINIDKTRVEALYWMLPSNLFTSQLEILKIKKYGAYADAKGNIQLKGPLMKPEVYGGADFSNVWVLDGLPPEVPKAKVKIGFRKDKVDVDVKVWATPKEYVTVVGWSDFFDLDKNEYQINSTDSVPLATAEKILVPVSDVIGFIIGPVPIMDIKGFGNIDLNAKGSKEEPNLNGYFRFNNATASFNGINLKLEKAFGKIDFKKDKIYFNTDSGTIYGQPAKITGVSDAVVNIDYKAEVNNIKMDDLLKTLKTSPMLKEQTKLIDTISSAGGYADLKLNVGGKITDVKQIMSYEVMKYITSDGYLNIKNGNVSFKNPPAELSKVNGFVKFNLKEIFADLKANIFDSPVLIKGNIGETADLRVSSDKMRLKDSIKLLTGFESQKTNNVNINDISNSTTFKMDMKYKGDARNIEFDKVNLTAQFPQKSDSNSIIDVLSGYINIDKGNINLKNINTKFYNTKAKIDGKINNAFSKPSVNGELSLYKLNLEMINSIKNSDLITPKLRKILNAYKNYKGDLSADLKVRNNNLNGNIWLRDISFIHSILEYPFLIKSADLNFKNSNLNVNTFNASFAGTPIFLKGSIKNVVKKPDLNIHFTSKLSSTFVDNYINTNLSYPINVNGEILLSAKISGPFDMLEVIPSVKLEEGADIYYMGANLGDENSVREFKGIFKKNKDKFTIKNLDYSKYIYSQNNRLYPLPLVNLNSEMKLLKNKIYLENFNLKTFNPVNANVFNAVFKKSLIKNGKVTCDLNLKGFVEKPKVLGTVDLKNLQIPSYETSIEDVNITFTPKIVDVKAKSNYMGSDIDILAKIKNIPSGIVYFENLEIHSNKLNLDRLLNSFNEISYSRPIQIVGDTTIQERIPFDYKNILIDNGKWIIDNISYKNLPANNFSGKLSFKNNHLKLDDINLDIAGGKLKGDFGYNFENATILAKANAKSVDANEAATALLDINNQIYGKLDGQLQITTFGASNEERLQNLNGDIEFSVNEGKMPKLGSIEYLLRAGNILKSGISGLTINNVTGLLIPVKTGDFDTIQGKLDIKNGLAQNIKIYSKGKNLSILLAGNYNLVSSQADIDILGKLSKEINTILGPIGNASLNSFFNLIPGIHLDETKDTDLIKQINSIPELGIASTKFRIFRAKVDGDIYSDNFVSTFEWLDK